MQILQVLASLDSEAAGPSYSVPRLAKSLLASGCDVELMSVGNPAKVNSVLGVRHHRYAHALTRLGPISKLCLSPSMRLALDAQSSTTDIIHTHGLWRMPNVYPSMTVTKGSPAVVLSPRGMLSPKALNYSPRMKWVFWKLFQGRAAARVAMFHATSAQEFEDIRAYGLHQPVVVVPNGIDVPEFVHMKKASQRKILFLGRIHPIKQIEHLITAWAALEANYPDWSLEIRGPGETDYLCKLNVLARSLRLARCTFSEPLFGQAKLDAFRQASLFVLPSASENFGMTIAESLAAGTPVIATKGAPWSGLSTNRCGWWVDQSVEALTAALGAAMMIPEHELDRMGLRGREWMLKDFSWDAIGRDMAIAYNWLRNGGETPPFVQI